LLRRGGIDDPTLLLLHKVSCAKGPLEGKLPEYRNPAVTVDAVWIDRGAVLLVRRGRPPGEGLWALPGGFVEEMETVEEAIVRELREETGLSARPARLVGVYSGPERDPRRPTITIAFAMTGRRGTPLGGDDAKDAAWVPLSQATGLAFDHDRILADAQAPPTRWIRPGRSVAQGSGGP